MMRRMTDEPAPIATYALNELCDLADVTPRTVRYYIQQGLLRSPDVAGPLTRYDDGHLWRLRLTKQLQREHLPLAEIRKRLAALSDDEVRDLVSGSPRAVRDSAADYIREVLASRGVPRQPRAVRIPTVPSPATRPGRPTTSEDASPPPLPSAGPPPPSPAVADDRVPAPSASEPPPMTTPAPTAPDRSQWDRVSVTPDVEIHVRRPLGRDANRRVDRLISIARQLLEEDTP
jgi:DNA-binding transcriptional MerR regulator